MSMDYKEATTPTLTLDPFQEVKNAEIIDLGAPEPAEGMNDSVLTPEEKQMVDDFAKQIDFDNSTAILQYGAGTQKKMADFSGNALDKVRSKDLGEVGDLLSNVVVELKGFNAKEEKGFLGIFKKK